MLHLQVTKTTMELLPLVCVSLLTWSGTTFADENEPNVIKVIVEEGRDAILPCSLISKESIVSKLFDWKKDGQKEVFMYDAGIKTISEQFKERVLYVDDGLKSGNASIIIRNTKVADSGNYTCDFPQLQPRQIFYIKLHVGASPKPYTKVLNVTEFGALLQCEVPGAFPEPLVEWQDSDRKVLSAEKPQVSKRGDRFYVTLLATVTRTKTNHFYCVAKQEEISHIIEDDVYVHDTTAENSEFPTGLVVGLVLVALFVGVLLGAGCCILQKRN